MPSLRYLMLRLYGWKMLQVYDRRKAILVEGTDSTPPTRTGKPASQLSLSLANGTRPRRRPVTPRCRAHLCFVASAGCYSGRTIPDPPISAEKSFSLGSPSFIGSTVSA